MLFRDVPVGELFVFVHEAPETDKSVVSVFRKTSEESYVDAENRGIHGDSDEDMEVFPAVLPCDM